METSWRNKPSLLVQRRAPVSISSLRQVKMMAAAPATRSRKAGFGLRLSDLTNLTGCGQRVQGARDQHCKDDGLQEGVICVAQHGSYLTLRKPLRMDLEPHHHAGRAKN